MNLLPLHSQRGYIGLSVIAFLITLSLILYPWTPPKAQEEGCVVGEAPDPNDQYKEFLQLPAVSEMEADPAIGEFGGGPDPALRADFVLIRKNVPADSYAMTHIRAIQSPQPRPGYYLAYPSSDGGKHIDVPSAADLRLRHEGLIFFVDPTLTRPAKVVVRKTGPNKGEVIDDTVQLVDVYQDKRKFNQEDKGYETEDLFRCGTEAALGSYTITIPNQAVSPDKTQLQMEWFLMQRQGVWGVHCKPAVYLYPRNRQLVNVKVFPKGELSYTDPPYDMEKGWNVTAFPTGQIEIQNLKSKIQSYDYLYYESKIRDEEIKKPETGWVVKYDELEDLFNRVLPELGLNKKEQFDFTDYWIKTLPQSPYYFVGLIDKSQRDYLEVLDVTPKPDTSIRFSLFFEALDQPKTVIAPEIITPKRNGFTLVDWGGMIKLHPGTPFTCSQ